MASERIQRKLWSWYSRSYDGLLDLVPYQRLLDLTTEAVACGPRDTLVDLGCGTGNLLGRITTTAGTGATLVGVHVVCLYASLVGVHVVSLYVDAGTTEQRSEEHRSELQSHLT
jgi:SAM-dependent methyltransferase